MLRTIAPENWTFNSLRALVYATLCRFAYRVDDTNGRRWRDTFGTGLYQTYHGPGGVTPDWSMTRIDGGPIIFAFSGTANDRQSRDQVLQSALVPWEQDKGSVFGYVKDRFTAIRPELESLLSEQPTSDIYLTGHSLGGAVAQLFASHFQTSIPGQCKGVITFGSPRVGNVTFVRSSNFPHIRVARADDTIAHLPFAQGMDFSDPELRLNAPALYGHYGTEIEIGPDGSIPYYHPLSDTPGRAAQLLAERREGELLGRHPHYLDVYMQALAYHVDLGQDWQTAWRTGIMIDDLNRAESIDWRMASIYPEFFNPGSSTPLVGQELDTPLNINNPPARHQRHWSPSGRH